jgi:hypothetical protein
LDIVAGKALDEAEERLKRAEAMRAEMQRHLDSLRSKLLDERRESVSLRARLRAAEVASDALAASAQVRASMVLRGLSVALEQGIEAARASLDRSRARRQIVDAAFAASTESASGHPGVVPAVLLADLLRHSLAALLDEPDRSSRARLVVALANFLDPEQPLFRVAECDAAAGGSFLGEFGSRAELLLEAIEAATLPAGPAGATLRSSLDQAFNGWRADARSLADARTHFRSRTALLAGGRLPDAEGQGPAVQGPPDA